MSARFKPLAGQVIVVTGAGSGLGFETARLAAEAGAAVVLAAGDEATVRAACEEITKAGGRCHPVAGDPATAAGCDRVARAAAARFGRIDSWIDAGGGEAALAHAAAALAKHLSDRADPGALVAFGARIGREARAELRQAKGKIAATLIKLPKDWRHDSPAQAAAQAALHAVIRPMGVMAVAAKGKGLTAATQARKHPGLLVGVGLLAVAGAALWLGRGRVASAAAAVRPHLTRRVRPVVIAAAKRRPVQTIRLAAKHPRAALRAVRSLR
jgi:NAD(P)-dependent dehydrogenase (short-subunit alcohol dehydrogenase family)